MQVRAANGLGALACVGLMAYALYAQHVLGLEPCPLCIFQRVAVIVLGCTFIVAAILPSGAGGRYAAAVSVGLVALAGMGVAGRHVWLTTLPPDKVPACGPGLDFMLEAFPLLETLKTVLSGSGECASVTWRLLGLSMPAWVFLALMALGIFGVAVNWRAARSAGR